MISVEEALERILKRARPKPPVATPTTAALGLALGEDVTSDADSPPFDKSIVDGYAVLAGDLAGGTARLEILEEVTAGLVPRETVVTGKATRIMTGAPIPKGADAVVMVERTCLLPNAKGGLGAVEIEDSRVSPGQNIMRQGSAMRVGEMVLAAGTVIEPSVIGLLCELGRVSVRAVPRPTVAVLPTGNEIVPAADRPGPGQIRNTNGPMLSAAVTRAGGVPIELDVARDDMADLRRQIARGLESDVLILSGGVSAGMLDLVPRALTELGVVEVFHKIRFKPGKPLWFGVLPSAGGDRLVFGLPGNPVSSLVCFEMFVRPAIGQLSGKAAAGLRQGTGRLTAEFKHRGDRPTYYPALLRETASGIEVDRVAWQGSADLRSLAAANGLALFPSGDRTFAAGEMLDVFWLY